MAESLASEMKELIAKHEAKKPEKARMVQENPYARYGAHKGVHEWRPSCDRSPRCTPAPEPPKDTRIQAGTVVETGNGVLTILYPKRDGDGWYMAMDRRGGWSFAKSILNIISQPTAGPGDLIEHREHGVVFVIEGKGGWAITQRTADSYRLRDLDSADYIILRQGKVGT